MSTSKPGDAQPAGTKSGAGTDGVGPKKGRKNGPNVLFLASRIESDPAWHDMLRLNELTATIEVRESFPPNGMAPRGSFRPVREPIDVLEATCWFQANGVSRTGKNNVYDAIVLAAHRKPHHPVRTYLRGLKWDGTPRVGRLFEHYFNAEMPDPHMPAETPGDATPHGRHVAYLEHISRCFLVSAVARIERPGCKVDHLPIAVGPQAFNKSKAFRALCADERWFTDDLSPNLIERDTKESLVGKWVVELAEIPHVRKESERVKAFFSRQSDRFRRAYDRSSADWPRQCVFAGTSNDLEFVDATGNRRFWPFWVLAPIDVTAIERDRHQLWAEAMQLFHSECAWWLPPNIEAIARERQEEFTEEDIWESLIQDWITANGAPFVMEGLFAKDSGITPYRESVAVPKADHMRAAACLKRLGYRRGKKHRHNGKVVALWDHKPAQGGNAP